MKQVTLILSHGRRARLYCLTLAQHRVLKVTKGTRKSIVGWTVGLVGSEVNMAEQMTELQLDDAREAKYWNCLDS